MHVQIGYGESAPDKWHVGAPFRAGSQRPNGPRRKAKSIPMNATGLDEIETGTLGAARVKTPGRAE
ncbi:hypothetical protein Ait01nite_018910 [Actinoplanes italicus]|uniref:Uncharacterized protein n=1 Tax=Actinoplanes italicus TaxID=113567 RepID=A0A2T0KPM8_9ACTN|nr:hypothetical protein CLV67_101421 [Actinoplanes italicus]GIE28846.1 hypothetical protein Ait01nite_018910 [Actinoplanes italicus]